MTPETLTGWPASHAQRRLWLLDRITPGEAVYNMPGAVAIDGSLDEARLCAAFAQVAQRHESLRTTFAMIDGELAQIVHDPSPEVAIVDVSAGPDAEGRARALLADDARRPFDLAAGPLVRALLVRIAPDRAVFSCNVHHIVCDEWSQNVLLAELLECYAAGRIAAGDPGQYRDYALAQRERLRSGSAGARDYWSGRLRDLERLRLPADAPRPPELTHDGAGQAVEIDAELTAAAVALQRRARVTPFAFLTALTKLFLYRYSGQTDIAVGTPVSGRDHVALAGRIGNFVNTLVLRDRIDGAGTFRDLLQQVKTTAEDAYEHAEYPFDLVVADLDLAPDMAHSPLFDVAVIFQDQAPLPNAAAGLRVAPFDIGSATAKFDLSFYFGPSGDGLRLVLNYRTALFLPATIAAMGANFVQLLRAAVAEPDAPIDTLEIVAPDERQRLLHGFNDTAAAYPDGGIVALFEDVVDAGPQRIALASAGERWTYGQLNARANEIAAGLRERCGVVDGDRVGVLIAPSLECVAALLGVLKAGAAYVPLDPIYPPERLAFMLRDARVRVLVTGANEIAPDAGVPTVAVTALTGDASNPPRRSGPRDVAYVIYTSGSTGVPKGCCVEHRNVVRLLRNDRFPFAFSDADTWVLAHSTCFDFSVWEMYGALLYGGRLVVPDRETVRDVTAFAALLREHRVSVLNQTPAAFANLIACERDAPVHDLSEHLRYVIFGGDRLEPAQLRPWAEWYAPDRVQLVNMYGITETTVHVTFGPLSESDIFGPAGTSPIGVPLPDTTVDVVNAAGRLQPAGVAGELYVGGSGVCRGYLDRLELNAERFAADPYRAGSRIYKSGDVGRRGADGRLEHLGRNDAQVQVRGFRVELREIEARLLTHPAVERAVVIARDGAGTTQLVAYVIAAGALDVDGVRRHLRAALPEYMVPAHFVALDALPLTNNNKIDVARLPAPEATRLAPLRATAPRDRLERALQAIWTRVLGVAVASVDESYFNLGGDSIRAIGLINAIDAELGVRLAVKDVFRAPTIAGLAAIVRRAGTSGERNGLGYELLERKKRELLSGAELRAVIGDGVEDVFPLTDIESGMIFHGLLGAGAGTYHEQFVYELTDSTFAPAAFRESVDLLAGKHEILRTSFHLGSEPVQAVRRSAPVTFAYDDLRAESPAKLPAYLDELLAADRARPFDPALPEMWRMRVVHSAPDTLLLVWTAHHAIIDGWSNASFLTELIETYFKRKADPDFRPPALRASYRDVVADQLRIDALGESAGFWRETLAGAERTPLPLGALAPATAGERRKIVVPIAPALGERMLALAHTASVPVRDVYVAAFHAWMEVVTGAADVLFGIVGHIRPAIEDGDRIVGCCLNTVPFRARLDTTASPSGRIRAVHERLLALREHDKLSTRKIGLLTGNSAGGGNPLFDVLFNFVDFHVLERLDAGFLSGAATRITRENTDTPLDVSVSGTFGSYAVTFYAMEGVYDEAQTMRLARYFTGMLERFTSAPDAPIDVTAVLGDDAGTLLEQSRGPRNAYPRTAGISTLFAQALARDPAAIAVECGERALTYGELDARANGLAAALAARGVGAQEPVAVCLPRSEWTVVALLGILKAGAAYVPVDVDFPAARVALVLADAGCRYAITDGSDALPPGVIALNVRELAEPAQYRPSREPGADDLAYVIYTSGSTGVPKGALVDQRSVVRLVRSTNYVAVVPGDRIAQAGSIAFDASTFEIWGALLAGARVVMLESAAFTDLSRFRAALAERGITILFLTTSLFNQCAQADPAMFASLRVLLTGGENASPEEFERVRLACPSLNLVHVYGPTENTTFSTFYPVTRRYSESVPIGRPIANSTAYVLDRGLRLAPHGVAGEICTGGDGVARGYLNEAGLSAAKFVADPFAAGERLYRTGDLGRRDAGGAIEFLGRVDDQVKVRGFRVEPGEVEAAVRAHPFVLEAIVVPRRSAIGTTELAAYYTSRSGIASAGMRAFLARTLPAHMIPAHVMPLSVMPMSFTGKIDRNALPEPDSAPSASRTPARPHTGNELLLCGIWQTVLGRSAVGVDEDYFELGGDSIKAIQMSSRLQRAGWKLELRDLFAHPTIEALAPKLRRAAPVRARVEEEAGPIPLAPIQRWYLDGRAAVPRHFNLSFELRSRERVDEVRLRAALEAVWRHHDALRMTYAAGPDGIEQHAGSGAPVAFDVRDPAGAAAMQEELDPAAGPLFRAALVRGGDADRVVLVFHHLVADTVSCRIVIEDLERAYHGGDLPPKTDSFGRWTRHLVQWSLGDACRAEAAYWSKVFATPLPLLIPEHAGRANRYGDCRSVTCELSEAETAAVVNGKPAELDVPSVLLTALARALQPLHGRDAIGITVERHGREPLDDAIDVTRTVGWFTALVPVRVELTHAGFRDRARALAEMLRDVPRRGSTFGVLRYLAPAEVRERVSGALPNVSLNYLGEFVAGESDAAFALTGEGPGAVADAAAERAHVLDVVGVVLQRRLHLSFTYAAAQFNRVTIAAIAERMRTELVTAAQSWQREPAVGAAPRAKRFAGVSAADLATALSDFE